MNSADTSALKIGEKNLDEIEYLLTSSINGTHLLFDHLTIRDILKTPTEEIDFFNFDRLDRIQNLFTDLIKRESIESKRAFIESLSREDLEILVRTYFHIVDHSVLSAIEFKH